MPPAETLSHLGMTDWSPVPRSWQGGGLTCEHSRLGAPLPHPPGQSVTTTLEPLMSLHVMSRFLQGLVPSLTSSSPEGPGWVTTDQHLGALAPQTSYPPRDMLSLQRGSP